MNEADSVFSKEGSLVDVPYVEPSFFGSINVKSMIPRSHDIWKNDVNYVIWYVQYVMCCLQNDKYDDAYYSHDMTFLNQIWQVPWAKSN